MTYGDLVTQAMLDLGQIAQGETPTSSETSQGLFVANQILAGWKADENLHSVSRGTATVAAGVTSLTVGTAGTITTAVRPVRIVGARATAGAMQRGLPPLSPREFSERVDNRQGVIGQVFEAMAADDAQPTINLRFWPPTHMANAVEVDYKIPLITATIAASTDVVNLIDGGAPALQYALAVALGPSYGVPEGKLTVLAGLAKAAYDRMASPQQFISSAQVKQ